MKIFAVLVLCTSFSSFAFVQPCTNFSEEFEGKTLKGNVYDTLYFGEQVITKDEVSIQKDTPGQVTFTIESLRFGSIQYQKEGKPKEFEVDFYEYVDQNFSCTL